jgi:hypothetical protein
MRRVIRPFAAIVLAPVAGACFNYRVPASADLVPAESVVRATMRPDAADSLAIEVGPRVARVAGHLVSDSDGVLAIRGETVTRLDGVDDIAASTVVHVPRRLVQKLEVRRLDKVRSALVVGGVVAVTLALRGAAGSISGGGSGGGPGGEK